MAATPLGRSPAPQGQLRGAAAAASQTHTLTLRPATETRVQPVLRLRGAARGAGERSERRIQWAEDVVDNEGLGRKSSKGVFDRAGCGLCSVPWTWGRR